MIKDFDKIVGVSNPNRKIDDKLEKETISVKDIANSLKVSRNTVDQWFKNGKIRYYKIGEVRKVRIRDLIKFLKDCGNDEWAIKELVRDIKNRIYNLQIQQYMGESKDQDDRIRRYAEIENYLEGTGPIPWEKKNGK